MDGPSSTRSHARQDGTQWATATCAHAQVHKAKLLGRLAPARSRWLRRSSAVSVQSEELAPASLAAAKALASDDAPKDGVVAVKARHCETKLNLRWQVSSAMHVDVDLFQPIPAGFVAQVQYPDALETMSLDLKNIRLAASYLSKTELKFDLVSPVRPCSLSVLGPYQHAIREDKIASASAAGYPAHLCTATPTCCMFECRLTSWRSRSSWSSTLSGKPGSWTRYGATSR